ncbi:hypothetical protein [Pseudorhodoferax sp.]|uniref:hypothetical protein n=1 Tax=Pseudorhodoferax sp. TaxID=1993553 RepID=UPI002DD6A97A|nr:hypothetical protein [Pseudorhodoferax sp.]
MPAARHLRLLLPALLALLAGCDLLGIEGAAAVAAKRDVEGKAIGGACRHAGRAIEDCYTLNRRADKAAVFAGWREMNDYMRENQIEAVAPVLPPPGAPQPAASAPADDDGEVIEAPVRARSR